MKISLPVDLTKIKTDKQLLETAKWLEGKSLKEVTEEIKNFDEESRVKTKGQVGYVIEKGFFGIDKNSDANPDIPSLGIEIKTCALQYRKDGTINVKEPLSLGIINYEKEYKYKDITDSPLYKKNRKILIVCYIHDKIKTRSEYLIKYVFLWNMDFNVLNKFRPDYQKIVDKIKSGEAHLIHQGQHKYLTLCPKHNGNFKDPNDTKSKRPQPFNPKQPGEIRAFRIKNRYMNEIVSKAIDKKLEKNGWSDS